MPTGGAKQTTLLQFKSPTDNSGNPDQIADEGTGKKAPTPTEADGASASGQQHKRPRSELEKINGNDADIERLMVPNIDGTSSETSLFSSNSHDTIIENEHQEHRGYLPLRNRSEDIEQT